MYPVYILTLNFVRGVSSSVNESSANKNPSNSDLSISSRLLKFKRFGNNSLSSGLDTYLTIAWQFEIETKLRKYLPAHNTVNKVNSLDTVFAEPYLDSLLVTQTL
jgi:hypothetical protein